MRKRYISLGLRGLASKDGFLADLRHLIWKEKKVIYVEKEKRRERMEEEKRREIEYTQKRRRGRRGIVEPDSRKPSSASSLSLESFSSPPFFPLPPPLSPPPPLEELPECPKRPLLLLVVEAVGVVVAVSDEISGRKTKSGMFLRKQR